MTNRRRRQSLRDELWHRNVVITAVRPRVSFSVKGEKDPKPEIEGHPYLKLDGTLTEPIRDVHEIVFKLWPDPDKRVGPNRPVSVAYITNIRPHIEVIGSCHTEAFDYTWTLALSGKLTHAYMTFTKLHHNAASVSYLSRSNEWRNSPTSRVSTLFLFFSNFVVLVF